MGYVFTSNSQNLWQEACLYAFTQQTKLSIALTHMRPNSPSRETFLRWPFPGSGWKRELDNVWGLCNIYFTNMQE